MARARADTVEQVAPLAPREPCPFARPTSVTHAPLPGPPALLDGLANQAAATRVRAEVAATLKTGVEAFRDGNVPGTPYLSVDGQEVPSQYLQAGLVDYINSVRKQ